MLYQKSSSLTLPGASVFTLHPRRCGDPFNAIEWITLFRAMTIVHKKRDTFFRSFLVHFFKIIFTSDHQFYFWGFISTLPLIITIQEKERQR